MGKAITKRQILPPEFDSVINNYLKDRYTANLMIKRVRHLGRLYNIEHKHIKILVPFRDIDGRGNSKSQKLINIPIEQLSPRAKKLYFEALDEIVKENKEKVEIVNG